MSRIWMQCLTSVSILLLCGAALAASVTEYRIQLGVLPSESDARQLASALGEQAGMPLETLSFQGNYYVVSMPYLSQEKAIEAARKPQLMDLTGLDIIEVVTESAQVESGQQVYQIQLGNYSQRSYAETEMQKARSRGLSQLSIVPMDNFFKVRYGQFPSREAAIAELPTVQDAGFADAWVTTGTVQQGGEIQQILSIRSLDLLDQVRVAASNEQPRQTEPAMQPQTSQQSRDLAPIQLRALAPTPTPPAYSPPAQTEPAPQEPESPQPPVTQRQQPQQEITMTQPSQDLGSPTTPVVNVYTQPVRDARKGDPIPIMAMAQGADEVILNYRLKGGSSFIKVPMTKVDAQEWKAEIPAWAVTSLGVQYYILAKKGPDRYSSEGTKDDPYLIQVK
jgi:hypothetical protein